MHAKDFEVRFSRGIETHIGTGVGDYTTDWHFHDGWQVVEMLSGTRQFEVRGGASVVGSGGMLAIPPGLVHRGTGNMASFRMSYFPATDIDGLLAVSLHAAAANVDARTVDSARVLSTSSGAVALQHATAWLHALTMERRRAEARRTYAQARRFRAALGMAPRDFAVQLRVNAARRRLLAGDRVAAVAAELGFADQSHLGRQFKRVFGLTPGEYVRLGRQRGGAS